MGGVFSRSTRAASVSLVPAPSSPTGSAASSQRNHSIGSISPQSGPDSPPHSPTSLALPAATTAKTYLLDKPYLDSGSDSSDGDLEAGNGGDIKCEPPLSFCGSVRANVARRYEQFAMSKVGLVTRAFLMSLPQSLALSAALGFAFSGLVTPIIFKRESTAHVQTYFLFLTIASLVLSSVAVIYDTFYRLKSYYNKTNYESFGIFRLRAAFMGAALGDAILRTVLYDVAHSEDVWLNFFLTLPATVIPACWRYFQFNHDIIPGSLSNQIVTRHLLDNGNSVVKNRFVSAALSACVSASSGLLLYRSVVSLMLKEDYQNFSLMKILSAAIPGVLGAAAKFSASSYPDLSYRWKQFLILAGDAAIIFIGAAGDLPNPKNELVSPDYWWGTMAYVTFAASVLLSTLQASRLTRVSSSIGNEAVRAEAETGVRCLALKA